MQNLPIFWTSGAEINLLEIVDFIGAENPSAALMVGNTVRSQVATLANFPNIGRPGRVHGTRELVISQTPYIVVYRVMKGNVEILRVLHSAQLWPPK